MKVLVSGGLGFIGSHLVDRLLKSGNSVVVIDDFSEGNRDNISFYNKNLEVHQISILEDIDSLFKDVDIVFHLAALPRPLLSIAKPKPAHSVNVDGTLNVLLSCRDNKVGRLVFASTAGIYGEQPVYPSVETAAPNPMSPYALHKLIGEQYCKLFENLYGLESNCLRFFNVYGSRMNPNGFYASLIPKFIKLIKDGDNPVIFGNGNQSRDFVHVDDAVEALVLASKTAIHGEVFNVGNGKDYSVNSVFDVICKCLDKYVEPIYGPAIIEPTQTLADRNKAYNVLGWKPVVSLEEGIKRLI